MRVSKAKYFRRFNVEFGHSEAAALHTRYGHLKWSDMRMPKARAKIRRKLRIVTIEEPIETPKDALSYPWGLNA